MRVTLPCLGLAALMFGASASLMAADLPRTK
ncbi:rod shape-determining protein RodA, partial [Pseudomonas aeruginosa]|nr:rod shape-determining protein RodA [Pseudomonas aeruginosa]